MWGQLSAILTVLLICGTRSTFGGGYGDPCTSTQFDNEGNATADDCDNFDAKNMLKCSNQVCACAESSDTYDAAKMTCRTLPFGTCDKDEDCVTNATCKDSSCICDANESECLYTRVDPTPAPDTPKPAGRSAPMGRSMESVAITEASKIAPKAAPYIKMAQERYAMMRKAVNDTKSAGGTFGVTTTYAWLLFAVVLLLPIVFPHSNQQ